jgi:3-oxoacyl-[acyl-carrier protein] reductase
LKTIILTGDSRGLGNQICETLLKEGYKVIGISRKESERTKNLKTKYKEKYKHINYDLSQSEQIKELYLNQLKKEGPIYGLINNAAIAYDEITTNAKIEPLEKMYKINVITTIMLTKYIIRDMLLNEIKGSIVNITSVCAHTGYKGLSMYASTKGAIEAFSKTVAREFGSKKIRSNCVAPGFMETDMSNSLKKEQKNRIYKRTSLKEATNIESVSKTVEFLLKDESFSITGQVIHVDNGTI